MTISLLREAIVLILEQTEQVQRQTRSEWQLRDLFSKQGSDTISQYDWVNAVTGEVVLKAGQKFIDSELHKNHGASERTPSLEEIRNLIATKKPIMHGSWRPLDRGVVKRSEIWTSHHPTLGRLYLAFDSSQSYKKIGRLRDPSGTRYLWTASLSNTPFSFNERVFSVVAVGEHNESERRQQVRMKMMKMFGVDPLSWLGSLTPKQNVQQPDNSSTEEISPQEKPATPIGIKKTYKIYGKLKSAPVHTRLKGKAYVGSKETKFSPGEQANVEPEGDKLRVKKVDSDHSQLWDPE